MKLINKITLAIIGMVSLSACVKKMGKEIAMEQLDLDNKALIQVYNASIPSSTTDPRRNYVYVNSKAVTGSALTYGNVFPAAAGFAAVPGYSVFLIRDTISTSLQPQISFAENLESGRSYTIFMYDTFTAIKQKTVQTDIVIPSDTTARIRFANFVYSPNQLPAFDLFSKRQNANLFSNISATEVTNFIPIASRLTDTLIIRVAGSGTDLLNRVISGTPPVTTFVPVQLILTPTQLRSYTVVFRGGYRNDLTGSASVRTLSSFTNN